MKFFVSLFILLSVFHAQANEGRRYREIETKSSEGLCGDFLCQIYFYGPELRYERDENQGLVQRKAHSYSLALRKGMISAMFEYTNYGVGSGNATLDIDREHKDYLLWGRLHYYDLNADYLNMSLYAGVAAGTYQETVTTTLSGVATRDNGGNQLEGSAALGVDSTLTLQGHYGLILAAELRVLFGKDYDPNPQASGLLRVGFQF